MSDIFFYLLCIFPCCIYVISSAPKFSVPVFISKLVQFFQITIPLIWTNIRTTLTFFIISTINMAFLFVKAMTSGGPNGASEVSLSYMYGQKDAGLYGYSMAIGVVIFIFSFALSALVNKVTEREPLEF